MKFIFFGTPDFAKIILEKLIEAGFIPATVVTNPDRPVGRKKIITPPPVKQLFASLRASIASAAISPVNKVNIIQPENLKDITSQLKNINPDFGVLAAYGKIIPKEIIDIFPKGIIVVHPSLLPKYRGATPIQGAILAGEEKTGTTLIVMDERVDHGPIIAKKELLVEQVDTYKTLSEKLAKLSADLLIETLPKYLTGEIKPEEQDHSQATYTKKLTTADGFINHDELIGSCHPDEPLGEEGSQGEMEDFPTSKLGSRPPTQGLGVGTSSTTAIGTQNDARSIWLKIRALNPEPGVYTIKNGRRMKILAADLVNGKLILKKIQFAGEKPIEVKPR